ncbi:blood group Rh(CE) polypeptide isoform X1 [Tamandua tetradactyla]|uniref:blood group Rh(CE) polypeptide isoform X1 n=1 Tax=Tamandua tetradactyla TaxID=48850 RepID=UPI004053E9F9
MGSKYPKSVRVFLPLWVLMLELAFILIFAFFTHYDTSSSYRKNLLETYRVFQDLTVVAALGLGFLTSSLRRHSWSSVAYTLFLLALGVQWAFLLEGLLDQVHNEGMFITLYRLRLATMSAASVLVSAGAVLGKVNLLQLVVMALVEVTAFGAVRVVGWMVFEINKHLSMMHIHVFAANFGLSVAWCLSKPLTQGVEEKTQMATSSSLFAMLGTLFLWTFWPSFNSALLDSQSERKRAVFNTHYALAVSAVTAISVSAAVHPRGKIDMTHIHNAVLAGGVAVGASCHLIPSPFLTMVLGLVAGLISIGGAKCLPVCFNRVLGIHDISGLHYTFGLPGLLGGITYIVLMMLQANWTNSQMVGHQLLIDLGALSLALAVGLASGLLTGLLLSLKIWKAPHMAKYFDDQAFWKFPHLAVGF